MNQIIKAFLLQHSKLVVNGLGVFEIMYKSAEIHPILHTFTAPGKYTVFTYDEKIKSDDFINYLSENQNITKEEAEKKVKEWVFELKNSMKTEKSFSLGTLGTFSLDAIGNLTFVPSLDTDISPESYGMENFTFPPTTVTKKEEIEEPVKEFNNTKPVLEKRKRKGVFVGYAFLIIFLLAIVGMGIYAVLYTQDFIIIKDKAVTEICSWFKKSEDKTLTVEPVLDTVPVTEQITEQNTEEMNVTLPSDNEDITEQQNHTQDKPAITSVSTVASGNTYIILGSFKSEENAKTFFQQKLNEYPNTVQLGQGKKSGLWMVGIGPYENDEAQRFLKENKINGWIFRK